MRTLSGRDGIASRAFDADGGDPLLALVLVLDLIATGVVRASSQGLTLA